MCLSAPLQILYTLCMFMLNKLIDWLINNNILIIQKSLVDLASISESRQFQRMTRRKWSGLYVMVGCGGLMVCCRPGEPDWAAMITEACQRSCGWSYQSNDARHLCRSKVWPATSCGWLRPPSPIENKKALLSQRWPRDAIHRNFVHGVHAYGHYTLNGFWFWTNLSSGNFVYFCKSDVSAVQGHPRSLILVPIESAYATSY